MTCTVPVLPETSRPSMRALPPVPPSSLTTFQSRCDGLERVGVSFYLVQHLRRYSVAVLLCRPDYVLDSRTTCGRKTLPPFATAPVITAT